MVVLAQHTIPAGIPPAFVRDALLRRYRSRMDNDYRSRRRIRPCHYTDPTYPANRRIFHTTALVPSLVHSECGVLLPVFLCHIQPFNLICKRGVLRTTAVSHEEGQIIGTLFEECNPPRVPRLSLQKLGPDMPVAAVSLRIVFRVNRESRLPIHVG